MIKKLSFVFLVFTTLLSCSSDDYNNEKQEEDKLDIRVEELIGKWEVATIFYLDENRKLIERRDDSSIYCSPDLLEIDRHRLFFDTYFSEDGLCRLEETFIEYKVEGRKLININTALPINFEVFSLKINSMSLIESGYNVELLEYRKMIPKNTKFMKIEYVKL